MAPTTSTSAIDIDGDYVGGDSQQKGSCIDHGVVRMPVKRITIPDTITHWQHPFFTTDIPRYLTPLPPPPGPVLGTLSSLVTAPKILDFEIIEGLGRIEEDTNHFIY